MTTMNRLRDQARERIRGRAWDRAWDCVRGRAADRGGGRVAGGGERERDGDRGAATIFVLALGLVLVAAGIAGAAVGAARVGRHQARTAADLGALAGAMRAVEGAGSACERARQLVVANGARMVACRLDGFEVVVEAQVTVTPLPGITRRASAAARAGPVSMPAA